MNSTAAAFHSAPITVVSMMERTQTTRKVVDDSGDAVEVFMMSRARKVDAWTKCTLVSR